MKRILLSVFVIGSFLSSAQTFVSTNPENRNVVLEEFTGIYCGYCPDGHLKGQQLKDNNPGDVVLINIHTGSYATPSGNDPNYQTNFGAAIASQAGIAGYPAGTINRHAFGSWTQQGGTAMSRGDWAAASGDIFPLPSPVNVAAVASMDIATGILTVDVEMYYTGNQTISSNALHVAVLQNNVEGPQSGSSGNPGSVLPNGNYNHQHMLRHLMTGQWGETITTISQGDFVSRQYTWTLPSNINNVDLDPTELEVVVFVSEDNQEIITGEYANTSVVFTNDYDANLTNTSATDIMCVGATTDLEVTFKNYGNIPLTSLDINYSINGGSTTTYPWNGNLSSGATETVSIPQISLTPIATNNVDVTLSNPNGNTDQNTNNNNLSASFEGMYLAPDGQVSIEVTTDNYPSETTWKLKENGNIIASGGPYSSGGSPQTIAYATLTPGNCYTFVMEDSYGDGLLSPGSYKVKDVNNGTIVWGGTNSPSGNFTTEETTNFETEAATVSIEETDLEISIYPNPVKDVLTINGQIDHVEIYDTFGKLVLKSNKNTINTRNLSNGIYMVNIKSNDLKITKRITITK